MAWLKPQKLICPTCGRTERLTWVLGVPLRKPPRDDGTPPPNPKGYRSVQDPGGWSVERFETDQAVFCPECETEVLRCGLTAKD